MFDKSILEFYFKSSHRHTLKPQMGDENYRFTAKANEEIRSKKIKKQLCAMVFEGTIVFIYKIVTVLLLVTKLVFAQ